MSRIPLSEYEIRRYYETRGVKLPSGLWVRIDNQRTRQFAKLIEFADRTPADRFRNAVLDALDRFLGAKP